MSANEQERRDEADAELAKAIGEHTILVGEPTDPNTSTESRTAAEPEPTTTAPLLGQNADDIKMDVPAPEGVDP